MRLATVRLAPTRYGPFGARFELVVEGRRAGKKEKDRRHDDRRMAGDRAFREEHRKVEERQQERHEEEDARCDCGAQVSHENGEVGRRQRKTSAAMQH